MRVAGLAIADHRLIRGSLNGDVQVGKLRVFEPCLESFLVSPLDQQHLP